mmetsp:Transcript_20125/g.47107  ORF Transcript_20125/g.47107 Transcript_20125/m.47107 type:complete len:224 (-) Transcript_20125:107-778(-)
MCAMLVEATAAAAAPAFRKLAGKGTDAASNQSFYDDWAASYEKDTRLWGYDAPERVADFVKEQAPTTALSELRVLDSGAGNGLSGKALKAVGFGNIVGIDLSPKMAEIAKTHGCYSSVEIVDLSQNLPFADGSFDIVTCVGVLSYLEPECGVLSEFCRIVKPGGLICYTNRSDKLEKWQSSQEALESASKWKKVRISEALPYLPNHPEFGEHIKVVLHLYSVL